MVARAPSHCTTLPRMRLSFCVCVAALLRGRFSAGGFAVDKHQWLPLIPIPQQRRPYTDGVKVGVRRDGVAAVKPIAKIAPIGLFPTHAIVRYIRRMTDIARRHVRQHRAGEFAPSGLAGLVAGRACRTSGVSKAMLSTIERGKTSPTARCWCASPRPSA